MTADPKDSRLQGTRELRRLAEQADPDGHNHESLFDVDCSVCLFIQACTPQAILALLDRVAALEEGLRALLDALDQIVARLLRERER